MFNAANTEHQLDRFEAALNRYREANEIWLFLVEQGVTQLRPRVVMCLQGQFYALANLARWEGASAAVIQAIPNVEALRDAEGDLPDPLDAAAKFVTSFRELPENALEKLYQELGPHAERLRRLLY